jgi:hypothetical protein
MAWIQGSGEESRYLVDETEQLLQRYKEALKEIEKFGHSHGHGCGYTCANIAEKALKNDKRHN